MFDTHIKPPARTPGQANSGDRTALYLPAALAGDPAAFEAMTEPYRRELLTHCYRIMGSPQDAEDLVQETFLRAWRRLETFQGRASLRAWLYKIATNACLDALTRRPRRFLPPAVSPAADPRAPIPAPMTELVWLEPFPDDLLDPTASTPEARIEARESISLSFLVALQVLPPRQRCVLILSDVLDWHADELAEMLGASESSVNSLLQRARTRLRKVHPGKRATARADSPVDPHTKTLLDRYMHAWESADVDEIIALLVKDTTFAMPPVPFWLRGRAAIRAFISSALLEGEARGRWHLVPVRANGGHGFAWYRRDDLRPLYQAYAIQILTLDGGRLHDITTFLECSLFRFFNLPSELPG